VDVNVHPAKQEVRFRNSRDIHILLSQAVSRAIQEYQTTMKATIFGKNQTAETTAIPLDSFHIGDSPSTPAPAPFKQPDYSTDKLEKLEVREPEPIRDEKLDTKPAPPKPQVSQPLFSSVPPTRKAPEQGLTELQPFENKQRPTEHNLIIIGQFDDLYIFCKSSEGLLVIDQHAAHERLLYEKLRKQYLAGSIVRQNLMFPETIELSLFQAQLVEKNCEEIDRIGFSIREFGGNTYVISAVPALAGTISPQQLFLDIIEQFGSEGNKGDAGGFLDNILATMACKAAVKAGTVLSRLEIDKLLSDMLKADLFSHCPHGRPVIKQFSDGEVKKWFYRT